MQGAICEGEFELLDGRRATVRVTPQGWMVAISVSTGTGVVVKPLSAEAWGRLRPMQASKRLAVAASMVGKANCWEHTNCGREPGGPAIDEFGAFPAATLTTVHGVNDGTNGDRACWAIAGTLCGGPVVGSTALTLGSCLSCYFYKKVVREEGHSIAHAGRILDLLSGREKSAP